MDQSGNRKLLVKELVRYYNGLNPQERQKLKDMYLKKNPELWSLIQDKLSESNG